METYDPERAIDPDEWNSLDESERQSLVEGYHRKKHIKMPNSNLHAAIHVVVENQVALGGEIPVQETLARLMGEGLSRHESVHAVGSVLAGILFDLSKYAEKGQDLNEDYYQQLEELTAENWLRNINEEEDGS
jgi:hypothetical protein